MKKQQIEVDKNKIEYLIKFKVAGKKDTRRMWTKDREEIKKKLINESLYEAEVYEILPINN